MTLPADPEDLPPALAEVLDGFARHLGPELGRSPHTVRAYTRDVASLLEHASRLGICEPHELDVAEIGRAHV